MMNRTQVLETIANLRTNEVVVFTMGALTQWPRLSPHPLNFQVSGAMGYASSVGLGIALARPDKRVIVLDGDGSLLMNLGMLVTIASQSPSNLIHMVMQNGVYGGPGHVPIPNADKVSFCGFARDAGLSKVCDFGDLQDFREHLPALLHDEGPIFVSLSLAPGPKEPVVVMSEYDTTREIEKALKPS